MKELHIDIETYSEVDLTKSGLHAYVQSSSFTILLFAYSMDGAPVEVIDLAQGKKIPDQLLEALASQDILKVAHNAAFEFYALSKFYYTRIEDWRCTMIQAYYCHLPGSLKQLGEVLGLPQDKKKDRTGRDLINYFCKPCKPTRTNGGRTRNLPIHDLDRWELFKEYNRQDVYAELAVAEKLQPFPVPDLEWQLWTLDQQINHYGINIDNRLIDNAIAIDEKISNKLGAEAARITGLENPNSVSQLKDWIEEKTGESQESLDKAAVKDLIATTEDPEIKRAMEIRQATSRTSLKKYQAMQRAECPDGRVRGLLQFYGTGTGRWSGRLVQVQNLRRNSMSDELLDLARDLTRSGDLAALNLIFDNVPDALSQLIRTAFIPSPGNRFIVADFSAIEARVIAWLAGESWRQEVFATSGKIYESSASKMFHVPIETIAPGQPNYALRQKGKVAELALGYQGSVGALKQMGALKMGLEESELPSIVDLWRASSPRIVDLWYAMDACAIKLLETGWAQESHGIVFALEGRDPNFLTVALPSGRKLFYHSPRLSTNKWGFPAVEYLSQGNNRKWAATPMYGGKWVENIVQAIARDCLAVSMMRLSKAGYQIVMHIHDEVVIDAPKSFGSLAEAIEIMREPIPWAPGLLLNAAGFEGDYYKKD